MLLFSVSLFGCDDQRGGDVSPSHQQLQGKVWSLTRSVETHSVGNMVPSHQSTSSFPLFGKQFTVDVNQTDSAPSSRPPINDDCHFMVGWTPVEGGWPGIVAPAVNPTGQHKPEGSRGRHLRGCVHFKLQCLTFAQAEAVVINQIWQRGCCGQMQTSSGCKQQNHPHLRNIIHVPNCSLYPGLHP